ncbi:unnamed protein product [Eruca vesicaria subsp. sativa]|uniref:Uncharacterized protein n=1 Tax=Eruca vesicaria subsp. sativa TaxID=29727 RepID=A0ABC8KIL2_ERUVS|nr:unnamed protein product [Eruca vesicaria subsp. sativa]
MVASRFYGSVKNLYLKAQDFPVVQDFSYWFYYDFTAIVADCLAPFDAQVAVILLSISKLVCKSDCRELSCLLSESWSFDVRSLILSLESLSVFMLYCVCYMANPLASLPCMSSLNGVFELWFE